ncbi:MAG: CRTAC1 family protein [Balneolaceae bacterium]
MNRDFIIKIIVGLIFLMLLSVPYAMKKADAFFNTEFFENRSDVIERYGFYLDDVTSEAGVDFVHRRAIVDDMLHHILPQISSVGASVSVADFNNDGHPDFYLTNSEFGTHNALYKNNGDGTFTDIAGELGLADLNSFEQGASMGSIWGDINNNGYEDLLIYRWGKPELFINNGEEGFTRVTEQAGLPVHINANTAIWFDYNNDGYLDLFIGGYFHEDVNLFDLKDSRMMPDSYEYATNGGRNYLLKNRGDGTFEDVSDQAGITNTRRWTLAAGSADIDGSGWPDLVLANDYGVDEILFNQNGETFISGGEQAGIGFVPKSGMSVSFGDVLNQGELSIYITNISEAGVLMQGNNLWVPSRRANGEIPRYRNVAGNMGVEIGEWGYGGKFVDFNNDGNIDIYVANGYVSDEPGTDYWYDYAKVVGGNRSIIMDAGNWPAMNNRTFSGYQTNKIWLNDGAGRFREVARVTGGALNLDSRSVAYADFFGNGAMDLIVANQHSEVKLYKNSTDERRNWVGFQLEGIQSNRSAIGAEVIVEWDGKRQKKIITGGDAFSSQSQRPLHFGLGYAGQVDRVEIRWPSGEVMEIEQPELNRYHVITE